MDKIVRFLKRTVTLYFIEKKNNNKEINLKAGR